MEKRIDTGAMMLPLLGIGLVLLIWTTLSLKVAPDLPSPLKTWQESQQYILKPFFKDGEMNQGILRFAFLSLIRVAKGFFLAIAIGTPLGFLLGLSPKTVGHHLSSILGKCGVRSRVDIAALVIRGALPIHRAT